MHPGKLICAAKDFPRHTYIRRGTLICALKHIYALRHTYIHLGTLICGAAHSYAPGETFMFLAALTCASAHSNVSRHIYVRRGGLIWADVVLCVICASLHLHATWYPYMHLAIVICGAAHSYALPGSFMLRVAHTSVPGCKLMWRCVYSVPACI